MRVRRCASFRSLAISAALVLLLAGGSARAGGVVTACHSDIWPFSGVNFATAMMGGGTITFQCPAGSVIVLTHHYEIDDSTTIDGGNTVTIDAGGGRMFVASHEGVQLNLRRITLRNAQQTGPIPLLGFAYFGSVVSGPMTVEMEDVTVRDSRHPIDVEVFRVRKSRFIGNYDAPVRVGTFDAQDTSFTCSVSSIPFAFRGTSAISLDNVSITGCGRIWSQATTTIRRSRFVNNMLAQPLPGGALVVVAGAATISKSVFLNNQAEGGGAIDVRGGTLRLRRVEFSSNVGRGAGGGAILASLAASAADDIRLELQYVRFLNNKAPVGGAVALTSDSAAHRLTLTGDALLFEGNAALQEGGGLAITGSAASLGRAVFVENKAARGGAVAAGPHASVQVANSLLVRNQGDGAAFNGPDLHLVNVTVAANRGPALVWRDLGGRARGVLKNSIVAYNRDGNCKMATAPMNVRDAGNNLQSDDQSCGASIPTADPRLDSQFYVPEPLSPARRAGDNAACLAPPVAGRDVYGERRPQGDTCTIGAVEGTVSHYALLQLRNAPRDRLNRELATLKQMVWPNAERRAQDPVGRGPTSIHPDRDHRGRDESKPAQAE